ncbi:MAG: hypothetical protein ACFFBS_09440 [Promethearchaeota archaeon]
MYEKAKRTGYPIASQAPHPRKYFENAYNEVRGHAIRLREANPNFIELPAPTPNNEKNLENLRDWCTDTRRFKNNKKDKANYPVFTSTKEPLEIRVGKVIIKFPDASSGDVAKFVGSSAGSVRTTKAWKNRKKLRKGRKPRPKGWKNEDGTMDVEGSSADNPQPEHYDILLMYQDYQSGRVQDFPTVQKIAAKLNVNTPEADRLIKEAEKHFNFIMKKHR